MLEPKAKKNAPVNLQDKISVLVRANLDHISIVNRRLSEDSKSMTRSMQRVVRCFSQMDRKRLEFNSQISLLLLYG